MWGHEDVKDEGGEGGEWMNSWGGMECLQFVELWSGYTV